MTADTGTPHAAVAADIRDRGRSDDPAMTADGRAADPTGDTARRDDAPGRSPRVVFCGGCNPHIDRGAVAAGLAAPSGGGGNVPRGDEGAGGAAEAGAAGAGLSRASATVYLSGCPRACASGHRQTSDEPGEVVVAGELVDGRPTRADDISATIRQKLKE